MTKENQPSGLPTALAMNIVGSMLRPRGANRSGKPWQSDEKPPVEHSNKRTLRMRKSTRLTTK